MYVSGFSADNIISYAILSVIDVLLTPVYILAGLLGTSVNLGDSIRGGRVD